MCAIQLYYSIYILCEYIARLTYPRILIFTYKLSDYFYPTTDYISVQSDSLNTIKYDTNKYTRKMTKSQNNMSPSFQSVSINSS